MCTEFNLFAVSDTDPISIRANATPKSGTHHSASASIYFTSPVYWTHNISGIFELLILLRFLPLVFETRPDRAWVLEKKAKASGKIATRKINSEMIFEISKNYQ